MKCEKSGNHTISYQSLLLSTTVLNDNQYQKENFSIIISVAQNYHQYRDYQILFIKIQVL